MLPKHRGQGFTVKAIGEAGEILFRIVAAGRGVQEPADGIVEHVVGKVTVLMLIERRRMAGHGFLILRGNVDPEGNPHHVEAEYIGIMGDFQIFAVVGEVDHSLQIEVLLRIVVNLAHHIIGVENAVGIGGRRGSLGIFFHCLEFVKGSGVAVVVIDMAAHDMQDDKIIFGWVELVQIGQQSLVIFIGEGIGIVCPCGMVCGFGDQGDGTVVLAVTSLIAEPPGFITGFFGNVDNGGRFKEFLAVVLALLRKRPLQNGNGLRP